MNSQSLWGARTIVLLLELCRLGYRAFASSTVGYWIGRAVNGGGTIARQSRLDATIRWGCRAARASWCYRWLTAEPEPDVVVIDLRETAVVGPILVLFDRLLAPFVRNWQAARTGTVVARLSARFVARPIQVVSIVALVAILTDLCLLVVFGSPSRTAVGGRLVSGSLALAGTRVTVSVDDLTEGRVYELVTELLAPPDPPERDTRNDELSK